MIGEPELARIVARIVAGDRPDAIALFGSYAIGRATDRSDLDLLVVKSGSDSRRRRVAHVKRLFATMYKVDVVAVTPGEFARERVKGDSSFYARIARQLRILYARPGFDTGTFLGVNPGA